MRSNRDSFSSAERALAKILSETPRLKRFIKKTYQHIQYLAHKKTYTFRSGYPVQSFGLQPSCESFVGYYDKTPVSSDGVHIIYQTSAHPAHLPANANAPVEVVCQNLLTGDVLACLPSVAYNWQQGTKLQWIGQDRFVFNAYDDQTDRYVAQVYDLARGKVAQTLPTPIYDCFGDEFAVSLSFDRLARLAPDYGYFCRICRAFNLGDLTNDGVFWVDLRTGQSRLVLSLDVLAKLQPLPSMRGAQHSVNHIMIAPDGKRFMVIHRWYQAGRRLDRLVIANVDGSDPIVLADEGMVSHCFWQDANNILGYLRHGGQDNYYMLNIQCRSIEPVGTGIIDCHGDGHPHIHGTKVVFDTYPNKARMKKLLLYDLVSGSLDELGEFYESFKFYGEIRCDLHPRFSPDGTKVFFDSVHDGRRGLYMIDLNKKVA